MVVQKKKYDCPRNENKGSRNKAGRGSALSEDQRSSWTEFIFFFFSGQDFHSREGFEWARGIWKREKKKEDEGGRESASYETLAHVTLPFTLQHPAPVPFLRIPLLSQASVFPVPLPFRGTLFSARSWRWYIKSNLILVKTKISILLHKGTFASSYL